MAHLSFTEKEQRERESVLFFLRPTGKTEEAVVALPVGHPLAGEAVADDEEGASEGRGVEAHLKTVMARREVAHGLLATCALTCRGMAPTAAALRRARRPGKRRRMVNMHR
jgi:hypothetical protein